jgi:hypothetical protein
MIHNNRGAPIVLGEASRGLVHSFCGEATAERLIGDANAGIL